MVGSHTKSSFYRLNLKFAKKIIKGGFLTALLCVSLHASEFVLKNDGVLKDEAVQKLNQIGAELKQETNITLALAISDESLETLAGLKNSLNSPFVLFVMSLKDKKIKIEQNSTLSVNAEKILENSVYPLLGQKNPNYAAAVFNGYADFADELARNAKVDLNSSVGNANRTTLNIIKIVFYGVIFVALLYYVSLKARRKRYE